MTHKGLPEGEQDTTISITDDAGDLTKMALKEWAHSELEIMLADYAFYQDAMPEEERKVMERLLKLRPELLNIVQEYREEYRKGEQKRKE